MTEDEMVGWHQQLNGYEFEHWHDAVHGVARVGQDLVTEKQLELSNAPGTHCCAVGPPSSQTGGSWCVQQKKGRCPRRERHQASSTVVSGLPWAAGENTQ